MKSMTAMAIWHMRVIKLYSITSKRNHIKVAIASTPPDNCLFLHNTRSATDQEPSHATIINYIYMKNAYFINMRKNG